MSSPRTQRNVAKFLNADPPVHAEDQDSLFVDREAETQLALEQLEAALEDSPRKILAIVGRARVGKSHFLHKLVRQIDGGFDACIKVSVAQGITEPAIVLREILSRLMVALQEQIREQGLGPIEGNSPLLPLEQCCHLYAEAIDGRKMQLSITNSVASSLAKKISGSTKLNFKLSSLWSKLSPFDVGSELNLAAERSTQETITNGQAKSIEVPPFSAEQICELIGWGHDLVRQAQLDKESERRPFTTLVVIDDFDLLAKQPNGAFDPRPLQQSLYSLVSQFEGFHVLTTVRTDTFDNYDKNFHEIASIGPFGKFDHLVEIFKRHVSRFHEGLNPFNDAFVNDVASHSDGRPGVFISFLRRAFVRRRQELDTLQSYSDQVSFVWKDFMQSMPWAVSLIEEAIEKHGGIIEPQAAQGLRGTGAMAILYEDYVSEGALTVDPLLCAFIREQLARK